MADGAGTEPTFTGRFLFSVEDVGDIGAFTQVSGLSAEVEVEELNEGGQNHFSHKLPGRLKWPNISLKRGVTDSDHLFAWFAKSSGDGFAGQGNKLRLTTGEIVMVDGGGSRLRTWSFVGAFPVKWVGPSFAASTNDVAVEELEIAHHGFRPS